MRLKEDKWEERQYSRGFEWKENKDLWPVTKLGGLKDQMKSFSDFQKLKTSFIDDFSR